MNGIEWHSPACSCPCALCLPVLSPSVVVSAPWTQDIKIACCCGDSLLTWVTSWASCRGSTVGWGRWAGYRHSGQPARWSRSANKHCCKVLSGYSLCRYTTQSTLSLFWYSMMSKTTSRNEQSPYKWSSSLSIYIKNKESRWHHVPFKCITSICFSRTFASCVEQVLGMGLCSGLSGVLLLWGGGVARPGSIARWRWAGLCRGDGDLNCINFLCRNNQA